MNSMKIQLIIYEYVRVLYNRCRSIYSSEREIIYYKRFLLDIRSLL